MALILEVMDALFEWDDACSKHDKAREEVEQLQKEEGNDMGSFFPGMQPFYPKTAAVMVLPSGESTVFWNSQNNPFIVSKAHMTPEQRKKRSAELDKEIPKLAAAECEAANELRTLAKRFKPMLEAGLKQMAAAQAAADAFNGEQAKKGRGTFLEIALNTDDDNNSKENVNQENDSNVTTEPFPTRIQAPDI